MRKVQPYLPWSDRFSVGVPALDADHRELVRRINTVCAACEAETFDAAVTAFDDLCGLAATHFEREEAILQELTNYHQLGSHAGEHRNRLRQLQAIGERLRLRGPDYDGNALRNELVDWFVKQTIGHDAAIKAFFDEGR